MMIELIVIDFDFLLSARTGAVELWLWRVIFTSADQTKQR